jgi:zinc protease
MTMPRAAPARAALSLAAALTAASAAAAPAPPTAAAGRDAPLALETFALPNGLSVTLHPDRRVPRVVIDTWFDVGSKDEARGRTGFAHLFEHLMFMGTRRVPGNQFDALMEQGGGSNNASTSEDRTNYYSTGPAGLLPTLLWLDADRLEALGANMTAEKLDLQRAVVRNERRQSHENTPYGASELVVPEVMFPPGHPYHHPVIGSHEDLEAATLQDVVGFFDAHYVPANASLVVAGDFDPVVVRPLVERWFGAIPTRPHAPPPAPPPARLDGEVRRVVVDKVELPRLTLVWHAPPAYAPGSAELGLLARVLGEGPSSRLVRRLVLETRLAESVDVAFEPRLHGSLFVVQVTAVPGADLEAVKREALAVLAGVAATGPAEAELASARARQEVALRQVKEDLLRRADKLNEYRFFLGRPDGFAQDLARFAGATPAGVRDAARGLGTGRLDLRVLPATAAPAAGAGLPETRPADLAASRLVPPAPEVWRLASGVEVRSLRLPGSGLFAGHVVFAAAERAVPAAQAGATALLAELLVSGAGGRSATRFAEALTALGGEIEPAAGGGALTVSVRGLSRNLEATLDLLADAVLRPTLAPSDFEREAALLAARVDARAQEPRQVAPVVMGALLFGPDDPRGRPDEGYAATVRTLTLPGLRKLAPGILHPAAATIVMAGDFEPSALRAALERRFGGWRAAAPPPPPTPPALAALGRRRFVLVDRPGAPQTVVLAASPVPTLAGAPRAARALVTTALGGSFTSRLMQNLREKHGYTYGAGSRLREEAGQSTLLVSTSVQTEVTGAALAEIRSELDGLSARGLEPAEAVKARETERSDVAEALSTAASVARAMAGAVVAGRPASFLADEVAALDAAEAAAAQAAATGGTFRFDALSLVLVGDRAKVLPQLAQAGLPPPEVVDAEGQAAR